ncbi:Uracil-DNA glycosylase superfamily [Methylocella silvestris BL2]|uniref:Type-5 uracil-DNA glycosylase n=1 Tax=Methylocella silvestris (strain DSM 15510 / CIP 108128 / LMG 27833 / NCIMB 13906 / BL2) TaxID=395965 RepID=B8EK23_METSB|nr:uracil-DNA glycosylase [Methylocella silvestris]ACK49970.1 Uracil-DNA glycosylase superfamily [Methylocella silvestris BL2]
MALDRSAAAVALRVLEPPIDCPLCPRLAALRRSLREEQPGWSNAPVPTFGDPSAPVLIVGLAPGLRGANRTGRPFTGDYAGDLLYSTLLAYGFATGVYGASRDDGLRLRDCAISNAVRCVPPQNKPTPEEIATCRSFLKATLERSAHLSVVVALGRIAHESILRALGAKLSAFPFAHGAEHKLPRANGRDLALFDSYHCSRYNTNTGVLTPQMFADVFAAVRRRADAG